MTEQKYYRPLDEAQLIKDDPRNLGNVIVDSITMDSITVGTGAATGTVSSNGNYDLTLQSGRTSSGVITIPGTADNANIVITPNGSGKVVVGAPLIYKKTVESVTGATRVITAADNGTIFMMNKADGITFTLPADAIGMQYTFIAQTAVTSVGYIINGAAATDLFIGSVLNIDTDSSNAIAIYTADGSDDYHCTLNGTTTGGLRNSWLRCTCVAANKWYWEGVLYASGTVATPFT